MKVVSPILLWCSCDTWSCVCNSTAEWFTHDACAAHVLLCRIRLAMHRCVKEHNAIVLNFFAVWLIAAMIQCMVRRLQKVLAWKQKYVDCRFWQ